MPRTRISKNASGSEDISSAHFPLVNVSDIADLCSDRIVNRITVFSQQNTKENGKMEEAQSNTSRKRCKFTTEWNMIRGRVLPPEKNDSFWSFNPTLR